MIDNTYNDTRHDATKHINVKFYYKRERVQDGEIILDYLETKNMLADGLSKMIDGVTFIRHKKCYMGNEMMAETAGVVTGREIKLLKAFKINSPDTEVDYSRAYMVCISDLVGSF